MEETETPHPDYLKGFNEGYMLASNFPELTETLGNAVGDSIRSQGFKAGKEQFVFEKKEARYPAWLKENRLPNANREQDLSKDHDKDYDQDT